ncbi:hypothetical protein AB0G04_31945 [Actinoplanes sp. NPDC023801]|uniref:hypothetical protein n=1 Tax=Actinoplanes sp. NPDC023801 TaxID=3154595 RepID=UPI0033E67170
MVGADAELHVFDYDRYRDEIVPALAGLLHGTPPDWLIEVIRTATPIDDPGDPMSWPHMARRLHEQPVDLAAWCDWLGTDLRYLGDAPVDRTRGAMLRCHSLTCPAATWCPMQRDQDRHGVEGLNALHEALIEVCCLGESTFVGRSVTPDFYRPVLERHGVPAGDPLRGLLAALATRGAALGYQFGVTEGIHGWLDGPETTQLVEGLGRLDLPPGEPLFPELPAPPPGEYHDWREVSLSRVRMVATAAAAAGRGVLWGNDVGDGYYSQNIRL